MNFPGKRGTTLGEVEAEWIATDRGDTAARFGGDANVPPFPDFDPLQYFRDEGGGIWGFGLHYYDLTTKTEILVVQKEGTIKGFQASPVLPLVETRIVGDHLELLGCGKSIDLSSDAAP